MVISFLLPSNMPFQAQCLPPARGITCTQKKPASSGTNLQYIAEIMAKKSMKLPLKKVFFSRVERENQVSYIRLTVNEHTLGHFANVTAYNW